MNIFFKIYTLLWILMCLGALLICIRNRESFVFFHKKYWLFLFKPWKLITITIACLFMTLIAPYSGDYTWDYIDGSVMSLLTCFTAPWSVGILYRFWKKRKISFKQVFVTLCFWMFSISWFYDIYMYLRDNVYPPTWYSNIPLSSICYICAGLLWSLDWKKEKGVFMSFDEDDWPNISKGRVFPKVFVAMLPYVLPVLLLVIAVIYGFHNY